MSDLEMRLLEVMTADAAVWRRRTGVFAELQGAPDKIDSAKSRSELSRAKKQRAARIANGLPVRPPRNRAPHGAWASVESADAMASCTVCGSAFALNPTERGKPQIYCSKPCRADASAKHKRVVRAARLRDGIAGLAGEV